MPTDETRDGVTMADRQAELDWSRRSCPGGGKHYSGAQLIRSDCRECRTELFAARRRLDARLRTREMMFEVTENKLNEYIVKTREAEARVRELTDRLREDIPVDAALCERHLAEVTETAPPCFPCERDTLRAELAVVDAALAERTREVAALREACGPDDAGRTLVSVLGTARTALRYSGYDGGPIETCLRDRAKALTKALAATAPKEGK